MLLDEQVRSPDARAPPPSRRCSTGSASTRLGALNWSPGAACAARAGRLPAGATWGRRTTRVAGLERSGAARNARRLARPVPRRRDRRQPTSAARHRAAARRSARLGHVERARRAGRPRHFDDAPPGAPSPIDYSRDVPTASVRVQDLFGIREHPTVARGQGPGRAGAALPRRPAQCRSPATCPGFWAGSWADVRKDMAGRYPKHQWPADPANATPKRLK